METSGIKMSGLNTFIGLHIDMVLWGKYRTCIER
jgi:hypothetical protein